MPEKKFYGKLALIVSCAAAVLVLARAAYIYYKPDYLPAPARELPLPPPPRTDEAQSPSLEYLKEAAKDAGIEAANGPAKDSVVSVEAPKTEIPVVQPLSQEEPGGPIAAQAAAPAALEPPAPPVLPKEPRRVPLAAVLLLAPPIFIWVSAKLRVKKPFLAEASARAAFVASVALAAAGMGEAAAAPRSWAGWGFLAGGVTLVFFARRFMSSRFGFAPGADAIKSRRQPLK